MGNIGPCTHMTHPPTCVHRCATLESFHFHSAHLLIPLKNSCAVLFSMKDQRWVVVSLLSCLSFRNLVKEIYRELSYTARSEELRDHERAVIKGWAEFAGQMQNGVGFREDSAFETGLEDVWIWKEGSSGEGKSLCSCLEGGKVGTGGQEIGVLERQDVRKC